MTDQPGYPEQPWDERFQPYVERGVHFVPHPDGSYEAVSEAEYRAWLTRDHDPAPDLPQEQAESSWREHVRNVARGLFGLAILILLARALWHLVT